jgi:hypothetical protein
VDRVAAAEVGEADGLLQQVLREVAPARRVADADRGRLLALALGDLLDDGGQQPRGERLRRPGGAAEQDRRRVAEPALELAGDAVRLGDRAALGGLADEQRRPPRWSTTDGTTAARVPSWATSARPPRRTAAAVKVVPRSTPRVYMTPSPHLRPWPRIRARSSIIRY